jgi:hypothetical protein
MFSYDLNPAVQQLAMLAEDASAPDVAARVHEAVATLRADPVVTPLDDGVRVTLLITVPDFPTPTSSPGASPTPSPLTPAELKAFQTTLDQWDSFLVFAIKQLGDMVGDQKFRDQLMQILLDSRFRLVQALQTPLEGGPDPVRLIFLDEWRNLHDVIKGGAARGLFGTRALEFLSFISAGDALFALDQAAPALGMRVSAQDLRNLAHIMAPAATGDPLAFSLNEDPDLKKIFKVPEPPESEGPLDTSEEENMEEESPTPTSTAIPSSTPSVSPTKGVVEAAPTASVSPGAATATSPIITPTPSQSAIPATRTSTASATSTATPTKSATTTETPVPHPATPTRSPALSPEPSPRISPTSRLEKWIEIFSPSDADAAETGLIAELQQLAKKLHRVVVDEANAIRYRDDMGKLLDLTAQRQLTNDAVDAQNRSMYLVLVKAAAWQESCWRQFVKSGPRVRWLESSTGDIGLMQVNKHVWRGFYNIQRLRWDVLYNAGAGSEILARMVHDVSSRTANPATNPDDLARSAYAAYNGGPNAYARWRKHEPAPLRQIDNAFWEKYRAIKSGQSFDILSCAAEWGHGPSH